MEEFAHRDLVRGGRGVHVRRASAFGVGQRDNRDYGGHRVSAIDDMEQAQAQLTQALRYDAGHPGR